MIGLSSKRSTRPGRLSLGCALKPETSRGRLGNLISPDTCTTTKVPGPLAIRGWEAFHFWSSYIHQHEYGQAWTSRFLYSPYQLLLLPDLRSLRAHIRGQRTTERAYALDRRFQLKLPEQKQSVIIGEAVENDEIAFLLSTIETKYLPLIYDRLTLHRDGKIESWLQTCRSIDPVVLLNHVDLAPETIKKTAELLLWRAQSVDPLAEWVDLVRLCHSEKWKTLRGDALIAMDYRIAAEILLLFLEDLVKLGLAEPLEQGPKYWRGTYHGRLKLADADLESVLMDFGISPQPSLVLVLEGDTEELIVPRVMKQLGIPSQTGFIELFKGGALTSTTPCSRRISRPRSSASLFAVVCC